MSRTPLEQLSPCKGGGDAPARTYLNTQEANAHIRQKKGYLEKKRVFGGGPIYFRVGGGRSIVYRLADLDAWVEQHAARSTSEYLPDRANGASA